MHSYKFTNSESHAFEFLLCPSCNWIKDSTWHWLYIFIACYRAQYDSNVYVLVITARVHNFLCKLSNISVLYFSYSCATCFKVWHFHSKLIRCIKHLFILIKMTSRTIYKPFFSFIKIFQLYLNIFLHDLNARCFKSLLQIWMPITAVCVRLNYSCEF